MEPNQFTDYRDFDHYLYPEEFHQAIDMVTSALDMDISEARNWIRVQATKIRQDLLVVANDVVARRLRIAPEGLV